MIRLEEYQSYPSMKKSALIILAFTLVFFGRSQEIENNKTITKEEVISYIEGIIDDLIADEMLDKPITENWYEQKTSKNGISFFSLTSQKKPFTVILSDKSIHFEVLYLKNVGRAIEPAFKKINQINKMFLMTDAFIDEKNRLILRLLVNYENICSIEDVKEFFYDFEQAIFYCRMF